MKQSYTNEKNSIGYTLVGDVYLPNLVLPQRDYEIGLWGQRYLEYIKTHRKGFYTSLKMQCKLDEHLHIMHLSLTKRIFNAKMAIIINHIKR